MKSNIPDFMGETHNAVEVSLNNDITVEELSSLLAWMVNYENERNWNEAVKNVTAFILIDGKRMDPAAFTNLIHGEWITLDGFVRLCARWTTELMDRYEQLEKEKEKKWAIRHKWLKPETREQLK